MFSAIILVYLTLHRCNSDGVFDLQITIGSNCQSKTNTTNDTFPTTSLYLFMTSGEHISLLYQHIFHGPSNVSNSTMIMPDLNPLDEILFFSWIEGGSGSCRNGHKRTIDPHDVLGSADRSTFHYHEQILTKTVSRCTGDVTIDVAAWLVFNCSEVCKHLFPSTSTLPQNTSSTSLVTTSSNVTGRGTTKTPVTSRSTPGSVETTTTDDNGRHQGSSNSSLVAVAVVAVIELIVICVLVFLLVRYYKKSNNRKETPRKPDVPQQRNVPNDSTVVEDNGPVVEDVAQPPVSNDEDGTVVVHIDDSDDSEIIYTPPNNPNKMATNPVASAPKPPPKDFPSKDVKKTVEEPLYINLQQPEDEATGEDAGLPNDEPEVVFRSSMEDT